jgi:hypothetical protein
MKLTDEQKAIVAEYGHLFNSTGGFVLNVDIIELLERRGVTYVNNPVLCETQGACMAQIWLIQHLKHEGLLHSDKREEALDICEICGEVLDPEKLGIPTCCTSAVLSLFQIREEIWLRRLTEADARASWNTHCSQKDREIEALKEKVKALKEERNLIASDVKLLEGVVEHIRADDAQTSGA